MKLPKLTITSLQTSLSKNNMLKHKIWRQFITDNTAKNGTVELRWDHADFTFMKMIISATSERVTGDLSDTIMYELTEVLDIEMSGMGIGSRPISIEGLTIEHIKPMLIDRFEAWNTFYARLPLINKANTFKSSQQDTYCIAIKQPRDNQYLSLKCI